MAHRYEEARTPDGRPISWCAQCKQPIEHVAHLMHNWELKQVPFGRNRWYAMHPSGITVFANSWQSAYDRGWEHIKAKTAAEKQG